MKMATLPQNVHALNLIYYKDIFFFRFLFLSLSLSFALLCFPLVHCSAAFESFDGPFSAAAAAAAVRFSNNTWHAFMEIKMMICI